MSADGTNDLFVRFTSTTSAATIQQVFGTLHATLLQTFVDGPDYISIPSSVDESAALAWLKADPDVMYAEADGTIQASAISPNDPDFSQQWGLNQSNNVDIDAPQAWSVTTGSPSIIVAVLDSGIDLNNADFAGRIWVNPNSSGSDGYPGDVNGWNFVNNNSNVQDVDGHGTHVSGIIAADLNNGTGVVGVAPNITIMPVKILDNTGGGSIDAAVSGIYFAVQHGARVINASWAGGDYSQALANAIAYAGSQGVVFVTAAGNDGTNNDTTPSYPASYGASNEIAVAAIDASGNVPTYSNYGAKTVALAAPGDNILSTVPGGFATYSGTSMATAFVSGVAALVLSVDPTATAPQVVQDIVSTTKPLSSLAGKTETGGMVDAYNAVVFAAVSSTVHAASVTDENILAQILSTNAYFQAAGGTNAGFVNNLYQTLLGRTADAAGASLWVGLLQGGASRMSVIQAIEQTPEAEATRVAHWYQDDLGSTLSLSQLKANAGVKFWAGLLSSGESDKVVLGDILSSSAFWAASGGSNTGLVTALYHSVLGRAPDSAGLNLYVGLLQSGMSPVNVALLLESSAEAKQVEVARWYKDLLGSPLSVAQLESDPGVKFWAGLL
jgi:subtilisin family serine protease